MNESSPSVKTIQSNWSFYCMSIHHIDPQISEIQSNKFLNFHNINHCDPWSIHLLNKVKSKRQTL